MGGHLLGKRFCLVRYIIAVVLCIVHSIVQIAAKKFGTENGQALSFLADFVVK